ncbi:MAG: hypothetical protein ACOCPX_02585 [Halapricum sp.]
MSSKLGYVEIIIGTAIAFGGTVQTLVSLENTQQVLLWGVVVLVGLFVLAYGVITVLRSDNSGKAADPNKAVSKTDSRFGRG